MRLWASTFFCLTVTFLGASGQASCFDTNKIYKVCSDQEAQFDKTLTKAKANDKMLLLVFGADWCGWCQSLHQIFKESDFLKHLNRNLESKIQVSELGLYMYNSAQKVESAQAILDRLVKSSHSMSREEMTGIPFLVLVRPQDLNSVFINTADLEDNSDGKGHDKEKIKKALFSAIEGLKLK